MPVLLNERDLAFETGDLGSILIVPCRFCPAASAAVQTVRDSLQSTDCRVIGEMEAEGIMGIQPTCALAGNMLLEIESVTGI